MGSKALPELFEPMRNFTVDAISEVSADSNGNFLEQHKDEMRKAEPGSRSVWFICYKLWTIQQSNSNQPLVVVNHSSFYGNTGVKNLENSLYSLLLAGTDTVSAFLEWFVMYMTAFPDVQEKCFEEIERVLGGRDATLQDRSNTHFMEATLQANM